MIALISLPYLVALLLGLAIPAGLLLLAHVARNWNDEAKLVVVLGAMILCPTIGAAFSGRVLHTDYELQLNPALIMLDKGSTLNAWANRVGTVVILALCLAETLRWFMGQRVMPPAARRVWLASQVYYVVIFGLAGLAGDNSRFVSINLLYVPIVFTGLALYSGSLSATALRNLSWVLRLVLVGTVLGAAVQPASFIQREYSSLIPGVSMRLVGPFDHANTLGCLAMLSMLLEMSTVVHPRTSWSFTALAGAVLIGAQSKTTWIAIAVIALLMQTNRRSGKTGNSHHRFRNISRWCWLLATLPIFYGLAIHLGWLNDWNTLVNGFTGRDKIWDITLAEFELNPFFGYGPGLWDSQYRQDRGMQYVGQAHNQFVQTLGQAGLFGFIALVTYLGVMAWHAWGETQRGKPLPLLCLMIVLVRCQMETPLVMNTVIGADALLHCVTFVLCSHLALRSQRKPTARTPVTPSQAAA